MPETQGRPWETFNNSESSGLSTMVLQMKVEAVNFRKSQEISLLWLDCFIIERESLFFELIYKSDFANIAKTKKM